MEFRARLMSTLRALKPLLEVPGTMVIGSEVPNLLETEAAATLVVSQDVDVLIPTPQHAAAKARLKRLSEFHPLPEEPSVYQPNDPSRLLELNLVGVNPECSDPTAVEVLDDRDLPLLVFGALTLLRPRRITLAPDLSFFVPEPAGLLLEKLLTERSGRKGDRDLLVAAGLLAVSTPDDLAAFVAQYAALADELRHDVRANLSVLSLIEKVAGMPDPVATRGQTIALLRRLEALEAGRAS